MLRYELHSNVAASEQGLQRHPELDDLVRTLHARQVEVRILRRQHAEEAEINLASARHARGVTVRGHAQRVLPAEAHLRGCLGWLRAVAARADRGLHAAVDDARGPNGTALLFAQVLGRGQHAFVSLPADDLLPRLLAAPDPALRTVPPSIAGNETLRRDYLERAARPTGFLAALERLTDLALLPPAVAAMATEVLGSRDPAQLRRLDPAQIVNIGLLDDVTERYERLVDQFCALVNGDGALGDLPQLFELLMQGVPLDGLHRHFGAFLLAERRGAATDKRSFVHELRIGLRQGDDPTRQRFRDRLLREVVRRRAAEDPRLYARVHCLPAMDPARLEALEAPRRAFLTWLADPQSALPARPAGGDAALPPPARVGLFELMVNLAYQARLGGSFRPGTEPPAVGLARHLLSAFTLNGFDGRRLQRLNPALPARGVARSLAAKVPVTAAEAQHVQLALWSALFPLGRLCGALYRELSGRAAETRRETAARARTAFLHGAYRLLRATNYVLGHGGGDPLLRQGALAAGQALGLNVLASRDQMRRRRPPAATDTPDVEQEAEGYQLLMTRDDARWFPMRGAPAQLAGAYLHLMRERVTDAVRRQVANKLNFLHQRHGAGLFAHLHDHVVWRLGLALSPHQLATLLVQSRVFDAARLREFGHDPAAAEGDAKTGSGARTTPHDPLLAAALAADAPPDAAGAVAPATVLAPFLGSRSEARCRSALKAFRACIDGYGAPAPAGTDAPTLAQALAALAAEQRFDLHDAPARHALSATREAGALTTALQGLLVPHAETLRDLHEGNEAVEVPLVGRMALLSLLREHHALDFEDHTQHLRLVRAAAPPAPGTLPGALAADLARHLATPSGKPLAAALGVLERHHEAWRALVQAAALPLLDQQLRETVLRIAEANGPGPGALRGLPPGTVLCVGASAHDQQRFAAVVARPDHAGAFDTLSGLMSRLAEFGRLREEMAAWREVVADVLEVLAGLNLSIYDAPYVRRYAEALAALDESLSVRPEELEREDLARLHADAQAVGALVRTAFEQERTVPLRDRWMNRIAMGLRRMHPNLHLTFVDALHENAPGGAAGDDSAAPAAPRRTEEHQTFSERVRRVIGFRERMAGVRAVVLAPTNPQRRLALAAIDQLYRLLGVHTPILVDESGCETFLDALRTRIPPHRLFDMNALAPRR